jgi:hypothetical protein
MKDLWKKYWLFFITVVGVIVGAILASTADARVYYNEETKIVEVNGGTNWRQWTEIKEALEDNDVLAISIWGPGGNAIAMQAIARLVRNSELPVIVPEDRACISACAIIVASASGNKFVYGELWFHGPHTGSFPVTASLDTYARYMTKINIELAFLFQEWGYGKEFYNWMQYRTSPCRFFVVNSTEDLLNLKRNIHKGRFEDYCPTQEQIISAY